jgi:hypothetical protein
MILSPTALLPFALISGYRSSCFSKERLLEWGLRPEPRRGKAFPPDSPQGIDQCFPDNGWVPPPAGKGEFPARHSACSLAKRDESKGKVRLPRDQREGGRA